MTNTFYFEDGMVNLFDEHSERVYDPMKGVLTEATDPNTILETITSTKRYLANKPAEKNIVDFIDRMIENPEEKGNITRFSKELLINPRTAERWWKTYKKTGEVPYKKSKNNGGPKSTFTAKHEDYIKNLMTDDSQLFADDIIEKLTNQFQDFSISKSQLNHHLRNIMQITVKKPHFEDEIRNSIDNTVKRYELNLVAYFPPIVHIT
ncbi:hypothetical protein K501DRAFT_279703 [Backusella circina FSU 941]|nr:hypothetical protein K501DRAFT_279703 [Backusella circina FSU 941]